MGGARKSSSTSPHCARVSYWARGSRSAVPHVRCHRRAIRRKTSNVDRTEAGGGACPRNTRCTLSATAGCTLSDDPRAVSYAAHESFAPLLADRERSLSRLPPAGSGIARRLAACPYLGVCRRQLRMTTKRYEPSERVDLSDEAVHWE